MATIYTWELHKNSARQTFSIFQDEEIVLTKESFCSSANDNLKYFGCEYCYKSTFMTQKGNTTSEKLSGTKPGLRK